MTITFEIPDDLADLVFPDGQDRARSILEAIALEGHRTERLSESEIRRLLDYETRLEVHGFLKEHGAVMHYTLEDFEHDREVAREISDRIRAERLDGPSDRRRAG